MPDIIDGFDVHAPVPMDRRLVKKTIAERDAIVQGERYIGLEVFVTEAGVKYILLGGTTNNCWVPIVSPREGPGMRIGGCTWFVNIDAVVNTEGNEIGTLADNMTADKAGTWFYVATSTTDKGVAAYPSQYSIDGANGYLSLRDYVIWTGDRLVHIPTFEAKASTVKNSDGQYSPKSGVDGLMSSTDKAYLTDLINACWGKVPMPVFVNNSEGHMCNWCVDTGIYEGGLKKDCGGHPPVINENHTSWLLMVFNHMATDHNSLNHNHRLQVAFDLVNSKVYMRRGWMSANTWADEWSEIGAIADGAISKEKLSEEIKTELKKAHEHDNNDVLDELTSEHLSNAKGAEQTENKGVAGGYAGLNENGKVYKESLDLYVADDEYIENEIENEYAGVENSDITEWVEKVRTFEASYRVMGAYPESLVALPKAKNTQTVFDENDTAFWSAASYNYHMAKIDVADYVGKKVKMYGFSRTAAYYPLAFFVDENCNILSRHGLDDNTLYGYTSASETIDIKDACEAVVPENAKYVYIIGAWTSAYDAIPKLEVLYEGFAANEEYKLMQSPLWGKKLYVDGDSICYGNGYKGGFGKVIADKYNMELVNNGVGGATLSMCTINNVKYGSLDWENNEYFLRLGNYDVVNDKNMEGFIVPITKDVYNNGFGVYPTVYKLVDGELVEQEYTETLPKGKFFLKFDVSTYDDNTVEKYHRMWAYSDNDGNLTGYYWLWEAYKSGFATYHEAGTATFGTARHWLCKSVDEIDTDADYIVIEGGINEYFMGRPIGQITEDMTGVVDITTTIGATEHLCRRLLKKCIGKKLLFVLVPKANNIAYTPLSYSIEGSTWTTYHDAILSVLRKYSIPVVDLFTTSAFNTELSEYLVYTMNNDGVHPNKEGYELFYVPQIVNTMEFIS